MTTEHQKLTPSTHELPELRWRKNRPGFRSVKTNGLIVYQERWHLDLLIQATLDPKICSLAGRHHRDSEPGDFALLLGTETGSFPLLAARDECVNAREHSSEYILVRRSAILAEPVAGNARAVWSSRRTPLSASDRLQTLVALSQFPEGVSIRDAAALVPARSPDPFKALLSLACIGLVAIDLRSVLSLDTIIRPQKSDEVRDD